MVVRTGLLVGSVAGLLVASGASAITLGVQAITSNGVASVAQAEAGIAIDVTQISGGARFTFSASGPDYFSLKNLYWDNASGVLGIITGLTSSGAGVNYSVKSSPGNFAAGNPISFDEDFEVRANNPAPSNGVNPGEWLGVDFTLVGGATFADLISDLTDGSVRIGIHAIAFANGKSESLVHTPPPEGEPIPLPSAAGLAALGLGITALRRRR